MLPVDVAPLSPGAGGRRHAPAASHPAPPSTRTEPAPPRRRAVVPVTPTPPAVTESPETTQSGAFHEAFTLTHLSVPFPGLTHLRRHGAAR